MASSEAEAIIAAATANATGKPNGLDRSPIQLVPFYDLTEPILTNTYVVKGWIVKGAIVLIFGEPGCGKSFLALDLAMTLAAGRPTWFGYRAHGGRVVYLAAEAGNTIRNQIAVWARERWDGQEDVDLHVITSPVDLCKLSNVDVPRLIMAIGKTDVLIVDTVSRAMAGGNENAPDDMGKFVAALDRLREGLGCTIIAVHHPGKDLERGSRGHTILTCAADVWILIERSKIDEDGDQVVTSIATLQRQRDGPAGTKISFKLRAVYLGDDEDGDPVTSCVVEPIEVLLQRRLARISHTGF